jgi:hypothetical protein
MNSSIFWDIAPRSAVEVKETSTKQAVQVKSFMLVLRPHFSNTYMSRREK